MTARLKLVLLYGVPPQRSGCVSARASLRETSFRGAYGSTMSDFGYASGAFFGCKQIKKSDSNDTKANRLIVMTPVQLTMSAALPLSQSVV
jgi:hypothetical protein